MVVGTRKTAVIRREEILDAASKEFAQTGLHGTSTDAIARRAGVSQPYLFRLFGTKRELFIATVQRCFSETHETFEQAARGKTGEEALAAMGGSYMELLADRSRLQSQMQAYAACDDPAVCAVVREGYGKLFELVERSSGVEIAIVRDFFARGMLLNVMAQMNLLDSPEPWAARLLESCRKDTGELDDR
jgi:AcrR family transcriptional regulator